MRDSKILQAVNFIEQYKKKISLPLRDTPKGGRDAPIQPPKRNFKRTVS